MGSKKKRNRSSGVKPTKRRRNRGGSPDTPTAENRSLQMIERLLELSDPDAEAKRIPESWRPDSVLDWDDEQALDELGDEDFDSDEEFSFLRCYDPRATEADIYQQILAEGGGIWARDSPLHRAQVLAWQAFAMPDPELRWAMAHEALRISPDCADAYVNLAEQSDDLEQQLAYYNQGIAAGERALGENAFENLAGDFWVVFETRPYLRACEGAARTLTTLGRLEEAIEQYIWMLDVNPGDQQGVRYSLLTLLLATEQDDEVQELLEFYSDDPLAAWPFTRALMAFRSQGDSGYSRRLLSQADRENQHVAKMLVGYEQLPDEPPDFVTPGDVSDAAGYVNDHVRFWRHTPGALHWVRDTLKLEPPTPPAAPRLGKKQRDERWESLKGTVNDAIDNALGWQVDYRRIPISGFPASDCPWCIIIFAATEPPNLVSLAPCPERPSLDRLTEHLIQTVADHARNKGTCPGYIEICRPNLHRSWQGKLRALGIECRNVETLESVDMVVELVEQMLDRINLQTGGPSLEDLVRLPQVEDEVWQIGSDQFGVLFGFNDPQAAQLTTLVLEPENGFILGMDVVDGDLTAEYIRDLAASIMASPAIGEPRRPHAIHVANEELRDALASSLQSIGIQVVYRSELPEIREALDAMAYEMADRYSDRPSLADVPGIEQRQIEGFYLAAAEYYRSAPWKRLPMEHPIEIRCDQFPARTWCGMVMGYAGMAVGFAMFDDLRQIEKLLSGKSPPQVKPDQMCAVSVQFDMIEGMTPKDLLIARRLGFTFDPPESYPFLVCLAAGTEFRRPEKWEVELAEACLRGLPQFVQQREVGNYKPLKVQVTAGGEEMVLELRWL